MDGKIPALGEELERGLLSRRQLLKRLAVMAGGTAAALALLPGPGALPLRAQVVQVDDERLNTDYVTYPGETGEVRAYLAAPAEKIAVPGVIVIHENRGLQPHIEDVARRVALEGFLALAVDALSPLGGTPAGDVDAARTKMRELDGEATVKNYVAAVEYLKTHPQSTGKVGCMGFCWGGGMTNQVAVNSANLDAAVPFYGRQAELEDVPKIKAAMLFHYGELDERINAGIPAYEAALTANGVEFQSFIYEGAQHAFFNDTNPDRYHAEAAALAWERTIAFFNEKLKT